MNSKAVRLKGPFYLPVKYRPAANAYVTGLEEEQIGKSKFLPHPSKILKK